MNQFYELKMEFGSLANLAHQLGIRESSVYQWVARRQIPLKHIKTLERLSEGRLTKELLRPDLFQG